MLSMVFKDFKDKLWVLRTFKDRVNFFRILRNLRTSGRPGLDATRRKFIFTHPVYLEEIRVKFVYEGQRVEVKVTGAKRSKIPIPANQHETFT